MKPTTNCSTEVLQTVFLTSASSALEPSVKKKTSPNRLLDVISSYRVLV